MANLAQIMKEEIRRLAKKEVKVAVTAIKNDNRSLRKENAALKQRVAQLEKDSKRLLSSAAKHQHMPQVTETQDTSRITSKGIRSSRRKLGLSQGNFAKLVDVSLVTVHLWEKKSGPLNLHSKTKAAVIALRDIGRKEANTRIEAMGGKTGPKRRKRK